MRIPNANHPEQRHDAYRCEILLTGDLQIANARSHQSATKLDWLVINSILSWFQSVASQDTYRWLSQQISIATKSSYLKWISNTHDNNEMLWVPMNLGNPMITKIVSKSIHSEESSHQQCQIFFQDVFNPFSSKLNGMLTVEMGPFTVVDSRFTINSHLP